MNSLIFSTAILLFHTTFENFDQLLVFLLMSPKSVPTSSRIFLTSKPFLCSKKVNGINPCLVVYRGLRYRWWGPCWWEGRIWIEHWSSWSALPGNGLFDFGQSFSVILWRYMGILPIKLEVVFLFDRYIKWEGLFQFERKWNPDLIVQVLQISKPISFKLPANDVFSDCRHVKTAFFKGKEIFWIYVKHLMDRLDLGCLLRSMLFVVWAHSCHGISTVAFTSLFMRFKGCSISCEFNRFCAMKNPKDKGI